MAKEPARKSVYIERQPVSIPSRVPYGLTAENWRVVAAEPTNRAYQTHMMRALKLEYKFTPKKGEDPKASKVKEIIKYYEELFGELTAWDIIKAAWEKDSYDLPFGGALEIGWWPDNAFGGKFPAGYPAWFAHVDAGTMLVNSVQDSQYPYVQVDPNDTTRMIPFKKREIVRLMYVPQTSIRQYGYQLSPTEQNYTIIAALAKLYEYDIKSLSDTPIAGVLDLMDFSEEDAVEWAKGFKEMLMGVEAIKIPILYEHEKPAQFVPFGQVNVDVKEKWKHYAEKCGNPYGLTIGSLGLYEHDRTLAGAQIQRLTTQRTGVGGYAYDERRAINRQFFPPNCPIMFEWDVPEIEDVLKRRQAEGTRVAYLGVAVDKGAIRPEDMLEQLVEDDIFSIKPEPGVIEPGIQKVETQPQQPALPGAPKPAGKYPEYPPAAKASFVVEKSLLLKQEVGDELDNSKSFKLMQESLLDAFVNIVDEKKVEKLVSIAYKGNLLEKGGPTSGFRGHKGVKGQKGGSATRGVGVGVTHGQERYSLVKALAEGGFSLGDPMLEGGEDTFLKYVQKEQGFDGLPQQVEDLSSVRGIDVYRGFTSEEQLQGFTTGSIHTGTGLSGSGSYFAQNLDVAQRHTGVGGVILKGKLAPGVNIVHQNDLGTAVERIENMWSEYSKSPVPYNLVGRNFGRIAALAGYDGVLLARGDILLVNRTALVIEKSQ